MELIDEKTLFVTQKVLNEAFLDRIHKDVIKNIENSVGINSFSNKKNTQMPKLNNWKNRISNLRNK